MKQSGKNSKRQMRQVYLFSLVMVLLVVITIVLITWYTMIATEAFTLEYFKAYGGLFLFLFIVASVILGVGLTYLVGILVMRPINIIIDGITKLSGGDYSVRISLGGYEAMRDLADNFNHLAEELDSTEILRSDFINNFSHEFKTPIMSIRGLVGMLQKNELPPEKQREYVDVIADEADRLALLATNVLNLSKVENQNILTDVKQYNLSEQIRGCLLLLEKKWTSKRLDLYIDFDEVTIEGNEDLLKQVWFNLLDNAVKFSSEEGKLAVSIVKKKNDVTVRIEDEGDEILEENKDKIFNKFFQEDSAHSKEGNGIGLSVVKHIVELHSGKIEVESGNGITAFSITLPEKQ